jgi:hypothetical protein
VRLPSAELDQNPVNNTFITLDLTNTI